MHNNEVVMQNIYFTTEQFSQLLVTVTLLNLVTVVSGLIIYHNFSSFLGYLIKKFNKRKCDD